MLFCFRGNASSPLFSILLGFSFAYVVFANSGVDKSRMRRQVVFTKSSKYFFRFNGKLNTLNYTTIVAFGYTIRMNWDLPHDSKNRFLFFKRDIHEDIDNIPDEMAVQGFSCVLKNVCQMYSYFVASDSCGFFCEIAKLISTEAGYEAQFFKNLNSIEDVNRLLTSRKMNIHVIGLSLLYWQYSTEAKILDTSRHVITRRSLIWSDQGTNFLQVIFGLGLPFEVNRQSVTIGTVVKGFYAVPNNSTIYTDPYETNIYGRTKRSTSRWTFYMMLETFFGRYNGGDGKSCLLKSICEASHTPLDDSHSILAEIISAILRPSSTLEEFDHHTNMDYVSAEKLGINGENCGRLYPECKLNILEQYTRFID